MGQICVHDDNKIPCAEFDSVLVSTPQPHLARSFVDDLSYHTSTILGYIFWSSKATS